MMDGDFNLDLVSETTVWSEAPLSKERIWDEDMNEITLDQLMADWEKEYIIK